MLKAHRHQKQSQGRDFETALCKKPPNNQLAVLLHEKYRRQFVGLLARQLGQGGVTRMAQVTELSRTTIMRGQSEISAGDFSDRIRAKCGGRSLTEKKGPSC